MTKDLEETLAELGPGYREVVDRVVGAYRPIEAKGEQRSSCPSAVQPSTSDLQPSGKRGTLAGKSAAYLVAASLLVLLGLGVFFREPAVRDTSELRTVYTAAYAPNETALASIVASQRPDGSWANDFLTRQNAAALRHAQDAAMHVAYKKAVRYLKSRGLRPLSDAELKSRGDEAVRLQAKI